MRVLIVDDHESGRRGFRALLSSQPEWEICGEAVDGIDGVEKAKALLPDVVLMDVSMPRMNGLDATRILRRELPEASVVIVSQNELSIVRRQAEEVDAAAFVTKSDVATDLLPAIRKVIAHRRLDPQSASKSKRKSIEKSKKRSSSAFQRPSTSIASDWVAGGGEMARLIREKDWSGTTLGPIDRWPQSLRIAVNLILNSRHPMWVGWGPEMPFLYNDAYISVLGLAKHPSALGRRTQEVWAEIWDICGPLAEKVFAEGEASFVDDVHFFMNRGDFLEENYVSFSYNPIFDESGKIAGLFCPNTDTTPKILNARRLRTLSELAAKALIERSTDAACASSFVTIAKNPDDVPFALLYLLDGEGRVAHLEQSAGISNGLDRICPATLDLENESAESQFWKVNAALNSGRPEVVSLKEMDSVPFGPAGQRVSQAITLPVTSGRQDRPVGVLIAGVNPTRKLDSEYHAFYELLSGQVATAIQNARAAEDDRKRAEALAEIDRAKTSFFNNVSHEFRTPLTLMLGPVEDLLSRSHTDLSPAAKNQLELVNRNGSRLLRLVNTLLDFSRIEAGRMQVVYQPTDLSAFTVELASVFRSATEKAGLRLNLDCQKLSEPVYVDRDMWEKIVLNLISNAFKFTFEGEIAVSLVETTNGVELRVRDTGVGVPANELPRLFDRFHRVQNTRSRTHEGTGIGLALVQELVRLHGGSVRVESAVGEGSTFIVSMPLGNAHLPMDRIRGDRSLASTAVGATPFLDEVLGWLPANEQILPADELPPGFELLPVPCPPVTPANEGSEQVRPRVLIADDNADMRKYLVRLLAERYDVSAFANGQAAFESVRKRPPDLILSDVMMPELDGFGLLCELRSNVQTRAIPIILLSARAGEESRVEGMEQGADDYLIKPFSARELLARVQTHLELARVRKQAEEALRQRTAQFETLLDAAPLAVYLVDADLRIRHINPPARLAFGEIPDVIGRDFSEVIHILWPKKYADEIVERFRHTLETGEPYFMPEHAENRADRGVREYYEWQINRIPLSNGQFGVVCYFRDISRLVHSREGIAESEKRLRLATEAVELGIWSWNPSEDRATWENDRVYEIFGRTREDGPLSHEDLLAKVIHREDRKAFETAMKHSIQTGAHFFSQFRIYRKDGSLACVEQTGRLEPRADGKPARIVGTILDITERKRALEMLSEHRDRFDLVAEAARVGFWLCDLPFDQLIWDSRVKEHFWLPPDAEVTMETFYQRLHPDDRERTRQAIAESNEKNVRYDIEYRTVSPDGREKWIRAMGRTFYDAAGVPKRFDGVTLDITERKNKENALVKSEERLRLAQKAARSGSWDFDLGRMQLISSPELQEIFGLTPAPGNLGADQWQRIIHPDDLNLVDENLAKAIETHGEFNAEFRINRGDGAVRWISSLGQIFYDDEGKAGRVVGVSTDITDRKEVEERERRIMAETIAATAKFRAVFEQSSVFAGIMTLDGTVIEANRLCLDACGYQTQDVIGKPFWQTPWWRGSVEAQGKIRAGTEQAALGTPYLEVLSYLLADGTERIVEFAMHPVVDQDGKVIYLHPTGIDITERKKAEQALRLSEERFRAIVETTADCVKLVARDGTLLQVNSSGMAMLGADCSEQIVGKNMYAIVAPKDREKYRLFHEKICDGEIGNLDFDIVGLKGIARHMETHAAPFRMPDGSIVHLAVTSDVTERERAAEELRRSEDKLRTLAGELEILVLTRTQELEERNQEVLRQSEQLRDLSNRLLQAQDQERRHIARELHDSAGQIVTVLGIYLARIGQDAKKKSSPVTKEVEECQELVQQLNKEIRTTSYLLYPPLLDEMGLQQALRWYIQGLMDRTGLEIEFKASEGFGRLPREMELVVYRLVQECLTNIHRHSGSKTAVIDFVREGETFSVEIQDAGRGIPLEKLKLLQSQGGGVGIRGMRERIRQFGGRMNIQSSESGTTISFVFQVPSHSATPGPENIEQQIQGQI